jgi:beta-phosphoglucomutase
MIGQGLGVIFDVDGVLVNSYRAHLESWQKTTASYGLSMSEPDFARTFGRTSREIIREFWPGKFDDAGVAEFDLKKEMMYRSILRANFPEMDGASALVEKLHDAGFKLAIGSSGPPENVAAVHETIRHGDLIQATVNGRDVKHGKPDPEIFLTAAKKLGLAPENCAVIEDAPVGLEAARRAGMAAIALTGTADRQALAKHAHRIVEKLRELTAEAIAELISHH